MRWAPAAGAHSASVCSGDIGARQTPGTTWPASYLQVRRTQRLAEPLLKGAMHELDFSLAVVSLFLPLPELEGGLENEGMCHGSLTGYSASGSFLAGVLPFLQGKRKPTTHEKDMQPVL